MKTAQEMLREIYVAGVTQGFVAKKCHVPQSKISRISTGTTLKVDIELYVKIGAVHATYCELKTRRMKK